MSDFTPEVAYHYEDIFLIPQKTIVESRKDCNTSVQLGKYTFNLPIYASNMKSVVDEYTCKFFAENEMFYTMHRFDIDQLEFIKHMHTDGNYASISVGVNDPCYEMLDKILKDGSDELKPEFITLDIANGWSDKAELMTKFIKDNFKDTFLIVGNVATEEATRELKSWGADAVKVGIAGGKVCITKNKTGFHVPMFTTVQNCSKVNIPIIADGGIREHGDIAKAISAGATMAMAGSLFAGYDQSAGDLTEVDGKMCKEYFGSASFQNKGEHKNVEGKKILIEYKGDMNRLITEITEDLQSSISYASGTKLFDIFGTPYCITR